MKKKKLLPKILIIDIETSPLITYSWGLFDQNIGLNQIVQDWHLLSFAAKWLGKSEIFYGDQSKAKDITNDKHLLVKIWKLFDEADVVLGQNSIAFDVKKIKARMLLHGMKPPSSFRQIDTLRIAKKHFAMTSNKLEFLSGNLCSKKKYSHKKFSGFELWKECLKGNKSAWAEMKRYNIQDVKATEELYQDHFQPWDNSINVNVYNDTTDTVCMCGSTDFVRNGFQYTSMGKFQRYSCKSCGAEVRNRNNLLSKEKKESLKR